jgi:3-deoxy-D-manno-octulosonic-acid transferase
MQSQLDRERIEAIGADPRKVTVLGNLKYDTVVSSRGLDRALTNVLELWNPLWIAASTMSGEEELVLDAFKNALKEHPDLKLLIAPRHPHRFDSVAELIVKNGFVPMRRTELHTTPASRKVLLLDTIGELAGAFQYGSVVFMGGTLVPTGGHNILEPARHGKPIVFGPHMENFREIARLFLNANGAVQIRNAAELAPAISSLLSNRQRASDLGRNALAVVEQNSGATERVLQILEPAEARR